MRIVDFHCDALSKLLRDEELTFEGNKPGALDVTYGKLRESGTLLQAFAVYISTSRADEQQIDPILESIDLFYEKVLTLPDMRLVRSAADLEACIADGKTGALLSLEGIKGLQGRESMLRILYRLGVRAAGFTWNDANWSADGVMEPRGGGLTAKGAEFVRACNELGIIIDVSHMSERAFWDTAGLSSKPIIASHSNAQALCAHPRNLTDLQIRAIIECGGLIGITYVPYFVRSDGGATIDDVLAHIDHICSLGGENHLMLGSDFDGIERYVESLTHPGQVEMLREAMLRRFSEPLTERILSGNAVAFLKNNLPAE
ncbi:membrane dipeptidase [Paenibacillus nanensis]|uniref:Membrane dipeptidase n=1 Tax=Paenibacillus nanensis TaxID=393251 RepID=A0A3A1UX35_9BACL|nr:dipeptidase [Paenibacillus nanensis]RIX51752.1 membrane dipeptidase [Paenibacillus nanensis]